MNLSLKVPARFKPRRPRASVAIAATVVLSDDGVMAVTVRNISEDGFMGIADGTLPVGSRIGIELPGCGIVQASVRWCEDGEFGAQFRRPIDLDQLEMPPSDARERTLFLSRILQGLR